MHKQQKHQQHAAKKGGASRSRSPQKRGASSHRGKSPSPVSKHQHMISHTTGKFISKAQKEEELKSMFEDKIGLLIPGVRGLSNQHADELSDQFKKAGGKVALPERVFRENIKETMRDLDYIITPKTKSVAKDLDRVHEKLKKACSRKTLQELLNEEGKHILIVAPEWLEECFHKGEIADTKKYEIRAPLGERDEFPAQEIRLELGEEEKIRDGGSAQKKESMMTDEKMLQSIGKSTQIDESRFMTPQGEESASKKRLLTELEHREHIALETGALASTESPFKPPLSDRFSSAIMSIHNDLVKEPVTLKRAPLNHELIEELELIRLNYKGKKDELKQQQTSDAINYLKDVPVFDSEQFLEALPNLPAELRHKIQEFVTRGSIDDISLLKVKTPLWEFLDTTTSKEESKQPQFMLNPAALYMEGFRSVADVQRHMEALSDEQKRVLSLFDEVDRAGPIDREEAEEFREEVEKTIHGMFEGASEVFEVELCGGYRRGDKEFKDVDILVTRKDEGPTRYMLLKLVESMEEQGIIVQQIKEIRVTATGSAGFQGIAKLNEPGSRCRRIDINVYPHMQKPFAQLYFTGPPPFCQWLKHVASSKGLSLSDSGLEPSPLHETMLPMESERMHAFEPVLSEEDIFRAIGLEPIPVGQRAKYGPEKVNNKEFQFTDPVSQMIEVPDEITDQKEEGAGSEQQEQQLMQ